jgi:hypothetical protein
MTMKTSALTCAALSALALAACQPAANAKKPGPAAPAAAAVQAPAEAEIPNYDEPLTTASMAGCEVVMQLADQAIAPERSRPTARPSSRPRPNIRPSWRLRSKRTNGPSWSVRRSAFYDQLTPAQLKSSVDVCLAAQDRHFTAEDG